MSDWQIKRLEDVVALRRGFDLPHHARRPGPFPVLSAGRTAGWHDQGPVKGPGFVIGRATNLGVPSWSDADYWPLNTTLYVADFRGNEPRYLFHLFETLNLSGYNSGSVQPMLNRNYVAKIPVMVAPLREQCAIVEVLRALDDKIGANVSLVETADALARATFDHMRYDSERIPLVRVGQFVNGKAFTKGATGTGRVVIRIAELNAGIGRSTVYNDIEVADQHVARPGDLLFAWSGSLTLHRWFRPAAIVNQHIFKVIPSNGYPIWCLYGLIARKLDEFKAIAADKATTMGHIQRRHLEEPVDVPARSVIEHYSPVMTTLWNRALLAEQESLVLASTRDALLPQLMSGKIRVKDAAKAVGNVS